MEEPRGGRGKLEESLKRKTFNVGNIQTRTVGWPVKHFIKHKLFSLIDYLFNLKENLRLGAQKEKDKRITLHPLNCPR